MNELTNFTTFISNVKKFGFSINNFYEVQFLFTMNPELSGVINSATGGGFNDEARTMMKLYTDECSIPGIQMATGEYRIGNTPTLKYVYGGVFSESNFSFIMDANSTIRKVFDIWTNYIYGYAVSSTPGFVGFNSNLNHRFRTRYRDDYIIDIVIIKYEHANLDILRSKSTGAYPNNRIVPDVASSSPSGFRYPVPVYSTRLINAFPVNIASVPLNANASSLNKLSVSFEYETITSNILTGTNSVTSVIDPVNN